MQGNCVALLCKSHKRCQAEKATKLQIITWVSVETHQKEGRNEILFALFVRVRHVRPKPP